jgi:hypothetical protein
MFATSVNQSFTKEMGYTHREFFRNLPVALKDVPYHVKGETISISYEDGKVEIQLGEMQNRQIASLSLPYMQVSFTFFDLSPEQREAFYTPFQRSYQKGGG